MPRINEITRDELAIITANSKTLRDILRALGYTNNGGGSWTTLKNRLTHDNIDFSHIILGRHANRGKSFCLPAAIPIDQLLVEHCRHSRKALKKAIIRHNLLPYECAECGIGPEWNNKPLTLTLDHKNGVNDDNRIENLRFICPNCDTQSKTYGSKNLKRRCSCGEQITRDGKTGKCARCAQINSGKCPDKETLAKIIWEKPQSIIAAEYGVSDKAVHKWCKKFGLPKPGQGYWRKLETQRGGGRS